MKPEGKSVSVGMELKSQLKCSSQQIRKTGCGKRGAGDEAKRKRSGRERSRERKVRGRKKQVVTVTVGEPPDKGK